MQIKKQIMDVSGVSVRVLPFPLVFLSKSGESI